MTTRSEDFIHHVFIASTHSYLLIFTDRGKLYWLKVYEIPDVGTAGKGKALVNLVQIGKNERIADIIPVRDFEEGKHVIMATRDGIVKKTALSEYANPRNSGIIAINIPEEDALIGCELTDGTYDVLLATRMGKAIRFSEEDARPMGRTARGVIGIRMSSEDRVVAMATFKGSGQFLTVTEKGFGKRTDVNGYPRQRRGGSGVINIKVNDKNGKVINSCYVQDDDCCMLITVNGKLIQLYVDDIRNTQGRAAIGVKCIDLDSEDRVAGVTVIEGEEETIDKP
jgi:DNA gyrase subunit A